MLPVCFQYCWPQPNSALQYSGGGQGKHSDYDGGGDVASAVFSTWQITNLNSLFAPAQPASKYTRKPQSQPVGQIDSRVRQLFVCAECAVFVLCIGFLQILALLTPTALQLFDCSHPLPTLPQRPNTLLFTFSPLCRRKPSRSSATRLSGDVASQGRQDSQVQYTAAAAVWCVCFR